MVTRPSERCELRVTVVLFSFFPLGSSENTNKRIASYCIDSLFKAVAKLVFNRFSWIAVLQYCRRMWHCWLTLHWAIGRYATRVTGFGKSTWRTFIYSTTRLRFFFLANLLSRSTWRKLLAATRFFYYFLVKYIFVERLISLHWSFTR